jgi:hypothetical protein
MNGNMTEFSPAPAMVRTLKIVAAAGGGAFALGAILAPERAWPGLLMGGFLLLTLGLSGIFFVALQYASGATWSIAFRRVPEAMSRALPYGAGVLLFLLAFGSSLYPWTHGDSHTADFAFKNAWLNLPFWLARAVAYLAVWILFAIAIIRTSRRQDLDGALSHTHKANRLSVAFLLLFSLTFWLASVDWIMTLEPMWFSTIFGVYNFAGMFSSGLAVVIILLYWLSRHAPLRDFVNKEHFHDLGKLLFGFSTFWMYIWFSQYMLIWYANIPEETSYYIARTQGYWLPLFILNMLLNWAIPFAVLLPRGPKRNASQLVKVAWVVVAGRVLDIYMLIIPATAGAVPVLGLWEIAPLCMAGAVFLLAFLRALSRSPQVPHRDPFLSESLNYHN